jgi:DNA polymerase III sliding clamp (beta) subunit (PCNA family)
MTGIHIKGDMNGLTFETTDGHRAHIAKAGYTHGKIDVIMPATAIPYYNLAIGMADAVRVTADRIEISFVSVAYAIPCTMQVQIRPIDGQFPDLSGVIKHIGATTAKVTLPAKMKEKISELKAVIKAMPKTSNKANLTLMVEPGLVVVTAMLEAGATRRIELPAKTTNGRALVGLEAKYFLAALEVAQGTEQEIQIHGDLAGLFFDSTLPNGATTRAIVMPCRL